MDENQNQLPPSPNNASPDDHLAQPQNVNSTQNPAVSLVQQAITTQVPQPMVQSFDNGVQSPKKRSKKLIIGLIVGLVVVALASSAFFLFNGSEESASQSESSKNESTSPDIVDSSPSVEFSDTSGAVFKARNATRVGDINNFFASLEEFHNALGYYPSTLEELKANESVLYGDVLVVPLDQKSRGIYFHEPVADLIAARAVEVDLAKSEYIYIPFPEGCSQCSGYVLKTFQEGEDPHVKESLN